MLSPGEFYKYVPGDHDENLLYRAWLIEACQDPDIRRGVKAACRQDIRFYINSFVYQYNPDDLDDEVGPLILYDFQEHAIVGADVEENGVPVHRWGILECIEDQKDARWPKSRKMGASWIALCTIDWLCMFHERKSVGVLSRDEDSVDRPGDPNSLFWKLDFIHEHLPDWLKGQITKRKMRFNYDGTNSYIVGEANTPSAFVSGRATIIVVDEFGQFKNGEETADMTSDVSFCRLFIFTHKDQAGMAYNLCFDAKYTEMREIKTHWSQHPRCNRGLYRYNEESNQIVILDKLFSYPDDYKFVYEAKPVGGPYPGLRSPWYDEQCLRRSDRDVAMNLDIAPRGASDRFFDEYRIHILKAAHGCEPLWQGTLRHNKETGQPLELVRDPKGLLKLWVHPKTQARLPDMRAGAAVDVASGSGATPSCLSMMNADTGQKFLEYQNANLFSNEFAALVVALCRLVTDRKGVTPLLCWEIQGSAAFSRRVLDLGYGPIYIRKDETSISPRLDPKMRPGFNASAPAVLTLMDHYRTALYEQRCVNPSVDALDECLNFVYTTSGVEYRARGKKTTEDGSGARLHHGDIVRADALALKMIQELGFEDPSTAEAEQGWVHPGTLEGRMKLAEKQHEDDLVWV